MAQDFYPFVENGDGQAPDVSQVRHPARIAVYDDAAAAPRVVMVEPQEVRPYLEEITLQVTQLAQGQGGTIPFMVIREIVENFIHAYFMEPTISILDHGNTIRFSDQGPGIAQKDRALQYGTTSATEEMRRYIRGVGSGLPYVQQYMRDKGGSLEIDDNISGGTVVTLHARGQEGGGAALSQVEQAGLPQQGFAQQGAAWGQQPQGAQGYSQPTAPAPSPGWQAQQGWQQPWTQQPQAWPQQAAPAPGMPAPQGWQQQGWQQPQPQPAPQQAGWPSVSVRGRAVLDYLSAHDAVGPSDLAREYGESQPTWTRELQALEEAGLIRKDGQKRRLTAMGRSFLS